MEIHLVVFNDGFDFRVEEAWFDGAKAGQRAAEYNGEGFNPYEIPTLHDKESLGPYDVQTVEISDSIKER